MFRSLYFRFCGWRLSKATQVRCLLKVTHKGQHRSGGGVWKQAADCFAMRPRFPSGGRQYRWPGHCYCHISGPRVNSDAKRRYVGLVAVGKNRLKTYLFRRCYETVRLWMAFPFPSHYLSSRTVNLAIVFTLKMSMIMMMMMTPTIGAIG